MKKLSAVVSALLISVQVFAFNFVDGNFNIDDAVNAGIKTAITQGVNNVVEENNLKAQNGPGQYQPEDKITLRIKEQMRYVKKQIDRNCNLRNRFPNKQFIAEQKVQAERYDNIVKWNIPLKISNYIRENFDFEKIEFVRALYSYVNETTIEVRFSVGYTNVAVLYTYTETPQQPSITHRVFK